MSCRSIRPWSVGKVLHRKQPKVACVHRRAASDAQLGYGGPSDYPREAVATLAVAVAVALHILPVGPSLAAQQLTLKQRLDDLARNESTFSGPQSPTQRLLGRVKSVQEVLQRVRLLVRAGDFGAARDLLRGREVGLLTQDLGYGTEAYRLFPQQAGFRVQASLQDLRVRLASPHTGEAEALKGVEAAEAALGRIAGVLEAAAD